MNSRSWPAPPPPIHLGLHDQNGYLRTFSLSSTPYSLCSRLRLSLWSQRKNRLWPQVPWFEYPIKKQTCVSEFFFSCLLDQIKYCTVSVYFILNGGSPVVPDPGLEALEPLPPVLVYHHLVVFVHALPASRHIRWNTAHFVWKNK